jgi:hypothetical protein
MIHYGIYNDCKKEYMMKARYLLRLLPLILCSTILSALEDVVVTLETLESRCPQLAHFVALQCHRSDDTEFIQSITAILPDLPGHIFNDLNQLEYRVRSTKKHANEHGEKTRDLITAVLTFTIEKQAGTIKESRTLHCKIGLGGAVLFSVISSAITYVASMYALC